LVRVAAAMSESPQMSLPKQAGGWADLKAAYRLLDNERIDPTAIGQVHRAQVLAAAADHPVVLLIQDDSDLQAVKIAGGQHVQHSTLAVAPGGPLLGVVQQAWFTRLSVPPDETRTQRMGRWRESCVWSDAAAAIGPAPGTCRFIHVADRAADDLNFMAACDAQGHGFVIRAQHDRRVDESGQKLWSRLAEAPTLGSLEVTVGEQRDGRGRIVRRQREATVAVAAATVELRPPQNHPGDHPPRTVQAIHLREVDPPEDAEPIDWMLLTGEPVETFADAVRLVGYYQQRWVIEEWHRALKEGCRLEQCQLASIENLRRLAALLSIIAVRLLQLRDLADPERQPSTADQPEALRRTCPALWVRLVAALAGTDPTQLTPRQFFLTIAKRGGHLARKRDGRPGWKTLWRGWYDITQMVRGAELIHQHPHPAGCG
jgi:hypothetical protein